MISIITPSYNSEKYIEACILSIKNQSFKDFEHIIVDGGSTDKTLDIIRKYEGTYPMHWISEKDNGMYDAISNGFKMAKGDIFCWLNSDDIYMPWTLDTVDEVFKDKNINWCTGFPAQLDECGRLYFSVTKMIYYPQFCIKKGWMDGRRLGCIQQESTFWRKILYEKAGGIDTSYKFAGDYALWVKFAKFEKLYSLNTVLAGFRVHSGQKSNNKKKYYEETHKLCLAEKIIGKLCIYRFINMVLKKRMSYIDVRKRAD